jgi:photosystem II stability/assembly factor-like uncharacterized protein
MKLNHANLTSFFYYLSIFIFIVSFSFPHNPVSGNWYQQWMPNLNGANIRDITFTDSLNGYAVTSIGGTNSYILKTSNSGYNWIVKFMHTQPFVRVQFINSNTGFTNAFTKIFKTIDAGENWLSIDLPGIFGDDMYVLNEDTIWLAMRESLTGGVFRTTNGGISWQQQMNIGNQNPSKIYMYNARIGFASSTAGLYKTTNSGAVWFIVSNDFSFSDMFFIDSLTGWKASGFIKKTTNGGSNWINQQLPIGNFLGNGANKFMNKNSDTIWAVGESLIVGGSPPTRGVLFRTTNGGNNWLFQLPDTSIRINRYFYGQFVDKLKGWAYHTNPSQGGIHTTTGGDTVFYVKVKQISTEVPQGFSLYQNYPNPFNSSTIIKFQLSKPADIIIRLFDITGREVSVIFNEKLNTGVYEITFDSNNYSSGVYFYSLITDGQLIDTKKMILLK